MVRNRDFWDSAMGEVIRVSGRVPDIGEFLREAMLSQRFADVALCCPGGQRFLAHRLVLSAASPYLQEVLLAHSKAATHCEPITVILAEVEGPELAAILGLVYTGSATVPRARLDAFLRAARALHIRLPPLPEMMTSWRDERPGEDVERDTKMDATSYHQCEQRPTSPFGTSLDNFPPIKEDPYRTQPTCTPDAAAAITRPHSVGLEPFCAPPNLFEVKSLHPEIFTGGELVGRTIESSSSFVEVFSRNVDSRPVPAEGAACPASTRRPLGYGGSPEFRRHEYRGRPRPVEEVSSLVNRLDEFGGFPGGSAFESRVPSLCPVFAAPSSGSPEKRDFGQTGEDLSCGESCCRWKPPRRHVANRATASPWRQLARPHHSPKIQPIVLQSHLDAREIPPRHSSLDQPSRTARNQFPRPTPESFRDYEVPTCAAEARLPRESDVSRVKERRLPELCKAQVVFPPCAQSITCPTPVDLGPTRGFHRSATAHVPRCSGGAVVERAPLDSTAPPPAIPQQCAPPSCVKPELSHPVSRLCDSASSNEPIVPDDSSEASIVDAKIGKSEAAEVAPPSTEEKTPLRPAARSDSNNNDASGNETSSGARVGSANPDDHRCDQCGKTFVTRASLKVHSRTHSGEKPFRCADCGKQFSQLRNYKYHRSVHEGTREFAATCPECGKYFNDRGYLSSHMKIHRNRKEYACGECGKSFNQRVAYNMHVRIHTGVKPHQCEQCGKAFSRKMLLKQHLRTHSGERPYQCQVCHKAFADRSNMTLHTRLHSGLKPYQCTLCSKAFTKKHHLKTHLNYHTGTKPYSCPNCGLRFSQSSNMRTHYKKCAVNNPNGVQASRNEDAAGGRSASGRFGNFAEGASSVGSGGAVPRTPTAALTPPNSDQESSILTPIPRSVGGEGAGA